MLPLIKLSTRFGDVFLAGGGGGRTTCLITILLSPVLTMEGSVRSRGKFWRQRRDYGWVVHMRLTRLNNILDRRKFIVSPSPGGRCSVSSHSCTGHT